MRADVVEKNITLNDFIDNANIAGHPERPAVTVIADKFMVPQERGAV